MHACGLRGLLVGWRGGVVGLCCGGWVVLRELRRFRGLRRVRCEYQRAGRCAYLPTQLRSNEWAGIALLTPHEANLPSYFGYICTCGWIVWCGGVGRVGVDWSGWSALVSSGLLWSAMVCATTTTTETTTQASGGRGRK